MTCSNCGTEWPEATSFCGRCGTKLSAAAAPAGVTATPPPPIEAPAVPTPVGAAVLQIGDITVTDSEIVTPTGRAPLAGSVWSFRDASRVDMRYPTSIIVLTVILSILCLLGLLLLLSKKQPVTSGYVEVEVTSGGFHHVVRIAVNRPDQITTTRDAVARAQQLSTAATTKPAAG